MIRLRPSARDAYLRYHAAVWPEVLEAIRDANIRNYSIFLKDDLLFGYYEYVGDNFEADMARMASSPRFREFKAIMDPMQEPLATRAQGEWWAVMKEIFHTE